MKRDEEMKNPLVYAYIGDCIYEFYVRKYLIDSNICKLKELQHQSLNYVSAVSQRRIYETLSSLNFFTEAEEEIIKWGRNAHGGKAKHADIVTYRIATGFECLIGYLYYNNQQERIEEIMKGVVNNESIR